MSVPVVTVDGPAGSGKTTLGRRLAQALGLPLVDTGLFYRGVMVAAIRAGLGPGDPERIAEVARTATIEVDTAAGEEGWQVRVDGVDSGDEARDPRHSALLTAVSRIPEVRRHLLALQRAPAAIRGAVAVGRDCGTVVFPDAGVKIYLQAKEALRAARRAAQLRSRGAAVDPDTLDAEITARDLGDAAAMAPAPDAVVIDTGTHGIDEMVGIALALCAAAGLHPVAPEPER